MRSFPFYTEALGSKIAISDMKVSTFEVRHEISYNVVHATSKASDQPALEYSMTVQLHHLAFLSLN